MVKTPTKPVTEPDPALFLVELTTSFLERLQSIEVFLTEAGAASAYDKLLDGLRVKVISNLRRFPRMGRRYLDQPPQSAEALVLLAAFPAGAVDQLREYLHGDYLILYTALEDKKITYLLSIRHHRQLAFKFAKQE